MRWVFLRCELYVCYGRCVMCECWSVFLTYGVQHAEGWLQHKPSPSLWQLQHKQLPSRDTVASVYVAVPVVVLG